MYDATENESHISMNIWVTCVFCFTYLSVWSMIPIVGTCPVSATLCVDA